LLGDYGFREYTRYSKQVACNGKITIQMNKVEAEKLLNDILND